MMGYHLDDLPKYSSNNGWPWYNEINSYSKKLIDNYPKISIVIPSCNQGEIIVFDCVSSDNTINILKKYDPWITSWTSEKDRGQAHAINKGFELATGEIMAWLNSDDYYEMDTFHKVAKYYCDLDPPFLISGSTIYINREGIVWQPTKLENPELQRLNYTKTDLLKCWQNNLVQPSTFWPRKTYDLLGNLDEDRYFALDLDYWLRAIELKIPIYFLSEPLSYFRYHNDSKSIISQDYLVKDLIVLSNRYLENNDLVTYSRELKKFTLGFKLLIEAKRGINLDLPNSILKTFRAFLNQPTTLIKYFGIYKYILKRSIILLWNS